MQYAEEFKEKKVGGAADHEQSPWMILHFAQMKAGDTAADNLCGNTSQ
jgi:hypothetical protein